jgi:hypothetical protein
MNLANQSERMAELKTYSKPVELRCEGIFAEFRRTGAFVFKGHN